MSEKQVSAARSKNSARDTKEDTREKDLGRANPGGHLAQCPHCSPLCEHGDEKSCSVTSDCPFQISRTKQYESAMSPGVKEKNLPRQWQNTRCGLRKSVYSLVQPRQDWRKLGDLSLLG